MITAPLSPAQLADRDAARSAHKAGRSRAARVTLPAPFGEVQCGAIELDGITYALVGFSLHVGATVRWL